jgi:glutathione S-transferase
MVPQAVLEELGAPYELVPTDIGRDTPRAPEYLALNPAGTVPTLDHDGLIVRELAAIALYLTDRAGRAELAPRAGEAERGAFLQWMIWLTNTLHVANVQEYYPERMTDDPSAFERVKRAAAAKLDGCFALMERTLDPGPYLLGTRFSVADIFLFIEILFHPDTAALLKRAPHLARLHDLVGARPAVVRMLAHNPPW